MGQILDANYPDVYHVYPLDEEEEHILCLYELEADKPIICKCLCGPTIKIEGDIIVVHSSFDGREGVEWANEILNEK